MYLTEEYIKLIMGICFCKYIFYNYPGPLRVISYSGYFLGRST